MSEDSLHQIELQLAGIRPAGAPRELRAALLNDIHAELRASRWDRRLARIAAVLLVVGVGMNVATGLRVSAERGTAADVAGSPARKSLVDAAVVVAEATDARTGSQYARQLAYIAGRPLSDDEAAAIDAAVHYTPADGVGGKKG